MIWTLMSLKFPFRIGGEHMKKKVNMTLSVLEGGCTKKRKVNKKNEKWTCQKFQKSSYKKGLWNSF